MEWAKVMEETQNLATMSEPTTLRLLANCDKDLHGALDIYASLKQREATLVAAAKHALKPLEVELDTVRSDERAWKLKYVHLEGVLKRLLPGCLIDAGGSLLASRPSAIAFLEKVDPSAVEAQLAGIREMLAAPAPQASAAVAAPQLNEELNTLRKQLAAREEEAASLRLALEDALSEVDTLKSEMKAKEREASCEAFLLDQLRCRFGCGSGSSRAHFSRQGAELVWQAPDGAEGIPSALAHPLQLTVNEGKDQASLEMNLTIKVSAGTSRNPMMQEVSVGDGDMRSSISRALLSLPDGVRFGRDELVDQASRDAILERASCRRLLAGVETTFFAAEESLSVLQKHPGKPLDVVCIAGKLQLRVPLVVRPRESNHSE
jgi:hypothetical protein